MKTKLHYVLSTTIFLFAFSAIGQNSLWKKVENIKNTETLSKFHLDKKKVYMFELNMPSLKQNISVAPLRGVSQKGNHTIVKIPGHNGALESFRIYEAPVLSPELAAKYPNIKSYVGMSIDNPGARLRMSISPKGIQTMISYKDKPMLFMQPLSKGSNQYVLYDKGARGNYNGKFECKTIDQLNDAFSKENKASKINDGGANDQTLQKFRIAISTTAEYTAYHDDGNAGNGDAVADAVAAIQNTLARVNEILETDMAVTLELIDATQLIYTNASTDPYSDASIGVDEDNSGNLNGWNLQLQNTLTSEIGNAAYDIGHLFGATGGGGNAGCIGCVCEDDNVINSLDANKGSGYTSPADGIPEGDTFDINYVIHEIGHQIGANHTFSYDTEGTGVNSEPGSGSTIMAYAGITGADNVQSDSDPYFHYHSIKQILDNLDTKTCQTTSVITNNPPIANAGNDYNIPAGTAYVLKGAATDADGGDALTYCWEQIDSGKVNYINFGPNLTSGSMNRSLSPTSSTDRYIPRFSSVLNGNTTQTNPTLGSDWETVSTVGRNLNWALTVRDRNPSSATGGQTSYDTMTITVEDVVPFTVTNPVSWAQGSSQIINWEIGQTTNGTINCQNVNIKLSTDGGLTFPTTIASNTPNDGSFTYTVPSIPDTSTARLLVEAADNIFYDVSNFDFTISQNPDFFITETGLDDIICGTTSVTYAFDYLTVNGFSNNTVFSVTGLPSGATAIFSPTNLSSSGTFTMTINDLSTQGDYALTVTGTSSTTKNTTVDLPFFNNLCNSIANTEFETSITFVQFNSINKSSGKPSGYSDYTSISTDVYINNAYDLTVNINTDGDYTTTTLVWIDWNQNCSFNDPGEQYDLGDASNVLNGLTANSPSSITVPPNAILGNTIMRVSTKFKDDGFPTSCENGFDGEVEDYTLNVISQQASISSVQFNTINNVSTIPSGYSDYTSISTNVNRNSSYPLSININTNGNFEASTKVWIDWNQNSSFEDSEEFYDLGNTINVTNAKTTNSPLSITVPIDAILGNTTMRVSIKYGDGSLHTSSENIIAGEVEDYTLYIVPTESIEASGFENFIVFPNPNNGTFTMQLNGALDRGIHVNIYDIRGQNIYQNTYNGTGDFNESITLNGVQSGMYILKVSDGIKKSIRKIIVE